MLAKADYVGCVSGNTTDKSGVFDYDTAETGAPIIKESPLVMECIVDDIYNTEGFDSFICRIAAAVSYTHLVPSISPMSFLIPNPASAWR